MAMPANDVPSAIAIQNTYHSLRPRIHKGNFSASELSALIALFSTLSLISKSALQRVLPSPSNAAENNAFTYCAFASRMGAPSFMFHGPFVRLVAADKQNIGYTLTNEDHFWLMRLGLCELKSLRQQEINETEKTRLVDCCVDGIREHYLSIRAPRALWGVHIQYLQGLAFSGTTCHCEEAVARIATLLRWYGGLNTHLLPVLWHLSRLPGLSKAAKRKLIHSLRRKVSTHPRSLSHMHHGGAASEDLEFNDPGGIDSVPVIQPLDATIIRNAFVYILFIHKTISRIDLVFKDLHDWALEEIQAVFRAHRGYGARGIVHDDSAWHNLHFLSLSHNMDAAASNRQGINLASGGPEMEVMDWILVCAMVAVQESLSRKQELKVESDALSQLSSDTQALVRTIWVLWRRDGSIRMRPTSVSCCAIVTFMRLAIITRDRDLRDAVSRYVGDAFIVPILLGEVFCHRRSWQSVSIEFAVMSAMFGMNHFLDIFDGLRAQRLEFPYNSRGQDWRNVLANSVIMRVLDHDVLLALQLYQSCAEAHVTLHESVLVALGGSSIKAGYLVQALQFLKMRSLPRKSWLALFDMFLVQMGEPGQPFDVDLARALSDTLITIEKANIRLVKPQLLQTVIQSIFKAGFAREAAVIARTVIKAYTEFSHPAFIKSSVRRLLTRHRYKCIIKNNPGLQSSPILLPSRSHQASKQRLRTRLDLDHVDERSPPFPHLALYKQRSRMVARTKNVSPNIVTLRLMRKVSEESSLDMATLERILYILVRGGRMSAAMRLLDKMGISGITTKAGNIVLTGGFLPNSSRRNARQVRHIMRRLHFLNQKKGFVPDRVTLNLIIMARLRWKRLASSGLLRSLFDRLICAGYPDGTGRQRAHGPFLTNESLAQVVDTNKHRPILMSFSRHIRPLYMMFIKAFTDRGDVEAAQKIREILEAVRRKVMEEMSRRAHARKLGTIRAYSRRAHRKQNLQLMDAPM